MMPTTCMKILLWFRRTSQLAGQGSFRFRHSVKCAISCVSHLRWFAACHGVPTSGAKQIFVYGTSLRAITSFLQAKWPRSLEIQALKQAYRCNVLHEKKLYAKTGWQSLPEGGGIFSPAGAQRLPVRAGPQSRATEIERCENAAAGGE